MTTSELLEFFRILLDFYQEGIMTKEEVRESVKAILKSFLMQTGPSNLQSLQGI